MERWRESGRGDKRRKGNWEEKVKTVEEGQKKRE